MKSLTFFLNDWKFLKIIVWFLNGWNLKNRKRFFPKQMQFFQNWNFFFFKTDAIFFKIVTDFWNYSEKSETWTTLSMGYKILVRTYVNNFSNIMQFIIKLDSYRESRFAIWNPFRLSKYEGRTMFFFSFYIVKIHFQK